MRWAKERLGSEEGREVERRDSRASQQDRKPRPPDQPPPTASKIRVVGRGATCWHTVPAVSKRDLRDSTC